MRILLATLCLNEIEHLPSLYEQHKNWRGLEKWVFVEAADKVYAQINPNLVSEDGLSVDGTTEYLHKLVQQDPRVVHIRHGFTTNKRPDQGKIAARQRYLDLAEEIQPDVIVVLDADEFYTREHQEKAIWYTNKYPHSKCWRFRQREIWRPQSIADNGLFELEVVGGYWEVRHTRFFRWEQGLKYTDNHNWPCLNGVPAINQMKKLDKDSRCSVECVHLGFASLAKMRTAKTNYYVARGEGNGDGRSMYIDCKRSFDQWEPGFSLPHGARVIPYHGPIPEVFQEQVTHA